MRVKCFSLLCVLVPLLLTADERPRWLALNKEAGEAARAKDYVRLEHLLLELKPLMQGNSRIAYSLAVCEARLGHVEAAVRELRRLANMGLSYDLASDAGLASIRALTEFVGIEKQMEQNRKPMTHSEPVLTLGETDLIPEDLAYDRKTKRFFVSSVRQAKITEPGGRVFARAELSIFALHVDEARRRLWATTGWVPHCSVCDKSGEGKTGLLAFDLDSGVLKQRVESPVAGVLGDMTISRAGDVYVSEGLHGAVFLLRAGASTLERMDVPGEFASPQTPALSADERTLYVPDYLRGIAAINLADRSVRWLHPADAIALSGIDGLYVCGDSFIAVQNGTTPPRIVKFSLDLQRQEVLEANASGLGQPNHGVLVGDWFYFIANSGWDDYDDDGKRTSAGAPTKSSIWRLRVR